MTEAIDTIADLSPLAAIVVIAGLAAMIITQGVKRTYWSRRQAEIAAVSVSTVIGLAAYIVSGLASVFPDSVVKIVSTAVVVIAAVAITSRAAYTIVGRAIPDGRVTGAERVGTTYTSTDGASVGAWVWLRIPGAWIVTVGDTGWGDLSHTVAGRSGGALKLRRTQSGVFAALDDLTFKDLVSGHPSVVLPAGYRVTGVTYIGAVYAQGGGTVAGGSYARVDFIHGATIRFSSATSSLWLRDLMTLPPSTDPWPSTLPA